MSRPFPLHEVLVIASGDDVASTQVSFIDPIFVMQDMIFAATTEAAVENVVTAFEREPHAFADNQRARAQLLAKHAEAADLRFRSNSPDNPGYRSAMAKNVLALPLHSCQSQSVVNHGQIVRQDKAFQHGMSRVYPRIEYSDFYSATRAVPQKTTRVIERRPRIQ